MYRSNFYGRMFWVDDNNDFKSCPLNVDNTGDFTCEDYVSEWDINSIQLINNEED